MHHERRGRISRLVLAPMLISIETAREPELELNIIGIEEATWYLAQPSTSFANHQSWQVFAPQPIMCIDFYLYSDTAFKGQLLFSSQEDTIQQTRDAQTDLE